MPQTNKLRHQLVRRKRALFAMLDIESTVHKDLHPIAFNARLRATVELWKKEYGIDLPARPLISEWLNQKEIVYDEN